MRKFPFKFKSVLACAFLAMLALIFAGVYIGSFAPINVSSAKESLASHNLEIDTERQSSDLSIQSSLVESSTPDSYTYGDNVPITEFDQYYSIAKDLLERGYTPGEAFSELIASMSEDDVNTLKNWGGEQYMALPDISYESYSADVLVELMDRGDFAAIHEFANRQLQKEQLDPESFELASKYLFSSAAYGNVESLLIMVNLSENWLIKSDGLSNEEVMRSRKLHNAWQQVTNIRFGWSDNEAVYPGFTQEQVSLEAERILTEMDRFRDQKGLSPLIRGKPDLADTLGSVYLKLYENGLIVNHGDSNLN